MQVKFQHKYSPPSSSDSSTTSKPYGVEDFELLELKEEADERLLLRDRERRNSKSTSTLGVRSDAEVLSFLRVRRKLGFFCKNKK